MFFFTVVLCIVILALEVSGQMGGWKKVDNNAIEVVEAVLYAIKSKYSEVAKYKVIDVKKQVVSGLLYDLMVQITPAGDGAVCEVNHFRVGNRFGTLSLLVSEIVKDQDCI